MKQLLFIGTSSKIGKGGIAYVLGAYKKLFPDSYFISTTASANKFLNSLYIISSLLCYILILTFDRRIRIIHIHGASYNSFYRKYIFFKISQLFKKKTIYHIHGGEFHIFFENSSKTIQKIVRDFIENADYVICLSEWWKRYFISTFNIRKIEIVPNVVIPPTSDKNKNDKGADGLLTFLFLGYVGEHKGVWFLLDVLRDNIEQIKDKAKFYIGGNGEINVLKSKIKEYNLDGIVEYIGWVTNDKKNYYLRKADIFLLPSYNEGLPISILEAMSYKLPILSTNVGGIPEVVSHENGILITPGNTTELKDAIHFFLNNSFDSMGQKSFEVVKKHFPEEVQKILMQIYTSL